MKKIIVMIIIVTFTFFNLSGYSFSASSSNVKGGWKFLTWGMSIDEANTLLVKTGMKKKGFVRDYKIIRNCSLDKAVRVDSIEEWIVKTYLGISEKTLLFLCWEGLLLPSCLWCYL